MNTNYTAPTSGSAEWDFSSLAPVWDYASRAIIAGADRLEALSDTERTRSLTELSDRIRTLTEDLDDGWLVLAAFFMIDDLYKSYFHRFRWSPGVHAYIAATAGVFLEELARRGFVLHYVIDSIQPEAELEEKLTYVPAVFQAAGLLVTGPQLMALELMQQVDHGPKDITAIPNYREEGRARKPHGPRKARLPRRHGTVKHASRPKRLPLNTFQCTALSNPTGAKNRG